MNIQSKEISYLIELFVSAIDHREVPLPPHDINWEYIYTLSNEHMIHNTITYSIEHLPNEYLPPTKLYQRFKGAQAMGKAREAAQFFALEEIRTAFSKYSIDFVPLKGCILKEYIEPADMRTMSDLDILYREKDTDKVFKALENLGYQLEALGANHNNFIRPPYVHIEMHKGLFLTYPEYDLFFHDVWGHVTLKGEHEYEMNLEYSYLFLVAHIAKHFKAGGTGLRSLMDIHIFKLYFGKNLDSDIIDSGLRKLGLTQFEHAFNQIDQVCFYKQAPSKEDVLLLNFIVSSGVYGSAEQHQLSSMVRRTKPGGSYALGKLRTLFHMIFVPLNCMKYPYPILQKFPFLLPFVWIYRILYVSFKKRNKILSLFYNLFRKDKHVSDTQKLFETLNIK